SGDPRDLPSFPTRRSSDLANHGGNGGGKGERARRLVGSCRPERHKGVAWPHVFRWSTTWCSTSSPTSRPTPATRVARSTSVGARSEEHTSELQSRENLVCR